MNERHINRDSFPEEKKDVAEAVYESLSDTFFERINFMSYFFSEVASGGTTVTGYYQGASRLIDTSEGRLFDTGRNSRMRCTFYTTNLNELDGYLLSPVLYDSFSSLNSISSLDILRAYVGLKFKEGVVSVAVKQAGLPESTYPTNISISGSGASDTHKLETKNYVTYTDILFDGDYVGSYETDMIGDNQNTVSFLPMFSPARSTDGTSVNITVENYQFIQEK